MSFVIKTTGCVSICNTWWSFHISFFFFGIPYVRSQFHINSSATSRGIPLWMHPVFPKAELRNRTTVMGICFYNSIYSSLRIYFLSLPIILTKDGYLGLTRNYVVYWIRLNSAHLLLREIPKGFSWISGKILSFHYLLSKNVCLFLPFFYTI